MRPLLYGRGAGWCRWSSALPRAPITAEPSEAVSGLLRKGTLVRADGDDADAVSFECVSSSLAVSDEVVGDSRALHDDDTAALEADAPRGPSV